VTGAAFWQRLSQGIEVVCVGELRGALLAHSTLGCPGVSTLLGNLCHTIEGHSSLHKVRRPEAARGRLGRWVLSIGVAATLFTLCRTSRCGLIRRFARGIRHECRSPQPACEPYYSFDLRCARPNPLLALRSPKTLSAAQGHS
jgi:hypothetical protein